ncbi:MAG: N-acetyltransferase [Clostridia bacterium]|nr:N-acetyltransferase [Clostridia bacterium]
MTDRIMIRQATPDDAPAIRAIYAYYVEHTAVTFDYETPTEEDFRARIAKTLEKYPYLVLLEDGRIRGYAYARAFVGRAAYGHCAETTIYLDHDARGRGLGGILYGALEAELKDRGIRNLYACIGDPITEDETLTHASERFHRHCGWEKVGTFHRCGYKFGRWYNMIWMEKMIGEHPEGSGERNLV